MKKFCINQDQYGIELHKLLQFLDFQEFDFAKLYFTTTSQVLY